MSDENPRTGLGRVGIALVILWLLAMALWWQMSNV